MSRSAVRRTAPGVLSAEDLFQHPGHLIRRAQQALNTAWSREVSKTLTSPQFAVLNALLELRILVLSKSSSAKWFGKTKIKCRLQI